MSNSLPDSDGPTRADLDAMFPPGEDDIECETLSDSAPRSSADRFPRYALFCFIIGLFAFSVRGVTTLVYLDSAALTGDALIKAAIVRGVIVNGLVCIFGVLGIGMMLARSRTGIAFAWVSVAGMVLLCVLALLDTPLLLHRSSLSAVADSDVMFARLYGVLKQGLSILLFSAAIQQFSQWKRSLNYSEDLPEQDEKSCPHCGRIVGAMTGVCPRCMTKLASE